MNCETTNAKTNNPMLPIDEPAASILAALLPRASPLSPRDSFFFFSCFSISVALAGKIAGKRQEQPANTGAKLLGDNPRQSCDQSRQKEIEPRSHATLFARELKDRLGFASLSNPDEVVDAPRHTEPDRN